MFAVARACARSAVTTTAGRGAGRWSRTACSQRWLSQAAEPLPPAVATHVVSTQRVAPSAVDPQTAFAVVRVNGKQFKVTEGALIVADRMKVDVGSQLDVDEVLLVGTQAHTLVGRPTIPDAKVVVSVEEHAKDEKVIVFKKKRRQGYKRKHGHRRQLTLLRVDSIEYNAPGNGV